MRFAFIFGLCLALVFVVKSFEEEEFIEDEEENDARHHFFRKVRPLFIKGKFFFHFTPGHRANLVSVTCVTLN